MAHHKDCLHYQSLTGGEVVHCVKGCVHSGPNPLLTDIEIPIPETSPRASHVRVSSYHRDPNGGLIAIDHAGESYTVTQEGTALEPRFTLRRVTVLIA